MFTRTLRYAATTIVALASLAACADSPIAPVSPSAASIAGAAPNASNNVITRDAQTVQSSFVVYASCANGGQGEVLQVNGTLEYRGHWITTNNGRRQHNVNVSRFTGVATGWETGDVYDVAQRDKLQSNIDYGDDGIQDSGEQLERIRTRLTSRATGAVYDITLLGRFVETPNGDFVLNGWTGWARCD